MKIRTTNTEASVESYKNSATDIFIVFSLSNFLCIVDIDSLNKTYSNPYR